MARVRAMFTSRDVLGRGLTALHDLGIADEQVTIREQRPRTGEPGFEYVDKDDDRLASVTLKDDIDSTLAATGDNLVGSSTLNTTDSELQVLLETMASKPSHGEERPEYQAGTRYQVFVATDQVDKVADALKESGGRDVKIIGTDTD